MHIQFDEQDSPENSPVEQKVSESQIKKKLNGPKNTSACFAVVGIVRDTSEEEDLENVTIGGYGVVWKGDVFPIQSGSYAGEANLNIFMELAASKAILESCPPEQPLIIIVKNAHLISLINTKKLPIEKRKRIMKPLLEEVRSLVLKRTAKVQAYSPEATEEWGELYQTAIKEATAAQEERIRLRPVKIAEILDRSTVQQGIQSMNQQEQKQAHESTVPENKLDLSTPVTTPTSTDIQKPSLSVSAPAPPVPVFAPETLSSTPEEATFDRRNGKKHDDDTNPTIATDEQSKTPIEESIEPAGGDSVKEEIVTTTTATTTTTTTTTAPTLESNGLKRMRTEDVDNGEPTRDESNILKKVKLTEETSSQNDTITQNDNNNENNGTQTGWLSWVKTMFGIKQ
ncbi:hypothetical protein INT45_002273 [Circinella minor]|uniref:Uncharacterized protein n=1 Tax=Circinella minor TaxID=1195481 RepID=A0A8H7VSX4_9FUNG|nr:hypothetical protein INT45_002273 [Circinella minor]